LNSKKLEVYTVTTDH